ncbi:MAG: type II toxin-antitoxin system Phd/YefM family antitoxin [Mollicutes bacterium]|nr:type II toxin-antitoxin system Phd/YefM family antitoxin [Mollicutes bacterium]MDY3903892.1 type II toxin-antitoxin system Phd/YefM family antitoxin [Candidatus Enteromonas sp.]
MVRNILGFRKNLSSYLESVIDFDERITITTKKGNAVIISEKEYKSMLEIINPPFSRKLINQIKEGEKEDISKMKIYNPMEEW